MDQKNRLVGGEIVFDGTFRPLEGTLDQYHEIFVPGTFRQSDEVFLMRASESGSMRTALGSSLYVANISLAIVRGGEVYLGIGGRQALDLLLDGNKVSDISSPINSGYLLTDSRAIEMVSELERSGAVSFSNARDMQLSRNNMNDSYRFFTLPTEGYLGLITHARMPFVNAAYGSADNLDRVMKNFHGPEMNWQMERHSTVSRIKKVGIGVMNPEWVLDEIIEGQVVFSACMVGPAHQPGFYAYSRAHMIMPMVGVPSILNKMNYPEMN